MRISKAAKRYAQGLLEFSKDSNSMEVLFGEMKSVAKILNDSKDLNSFLKTPIIDSRKKIAISNEIFSSLSVTSRNFISLIIKQGREGILQEIAQDFVEKVEKLNGVQSVSLTIADHLSQSNLDTILRSTDLINQNQAYDLQTSIKPEILGGYILRVGDQQIDASVRTKLSQLKKEFQLN